jgi:hypothetical protein
VERSGAADLVAATLRAIGEGLSTTYNERRSLLPPPPTRDLVEAIAAFARSAQSAVAIAAVDALGQAFGAGSLAASEALVAALEHPELSVAKAAAFKLAETQIGRETLGRALDRSTLSVRDRARELLADADLRAGRDRGSGSLVGAIGRSGSGPSSAPAPLSSRGGGRERSAPSSRGSPVSSTAGGHSPGQRRR